MQPASSAGCRRPSADGARHAAAQSWCGRLMRARRCEVDRKPRRCPCCALGRDRECVRPRGAGEPRVHDHEPVDARGHVLERGHLDRAARSRPLERDPEDAPADAFRSVDLSTAPLAIAPRTGPRDARRSRKRLTRPRPAIHRRWPLLAVPPTLGVAATTPGSKCSPGATARSLMRAAAGYRSLARRSGTAGGMR